MKKIYKIPVEYKMYGHYIIESDSIEEAIEEALKGTIGLPSDSDYVDESMVVCNEILADINEEDVAKEISTYLGEEDTLEWHD